MKRLLLATLALFIVFGVGSSSWLESDTAQAKTRLSSKTPIFSRMVEHTTKDLTFYVSTTGNDSNDCLSAANACLTIQEAIDRVPYYVRHDVLIDVGAGTFGGFTVYGKNVETPGSFTLEGSYGAPTLTTGTASGTASAGDKNTLTDSGQSWTVNELRGLLVKIGDEYRVVRENTGDTIELAGSFSANTSGQSYVILDRLTKVAGVPADAIAGYAVITLAGTVGTRGVTIRGLEVDGTGATLGIYAAYQESGTCILDRIKMDGKGSAVYGLWMQGGGDNAYISDSYVTGTTSHGYGITMSMRGTFARCYAYACGGNGFQVLGNLIVEAYTQELYADANGKNGFAFIYNNRCSPKSLYAKGNTASGLVIASQPGAAVEIESGSFDDNGSYGVMVGAYEPLSSVPLQGGNVCFKGSIQCSGNGLSGVGIVYAGTAAFDEALTGTGNTRYGIEFLDGSIHASAKITSATTITGNLGDASIDGGQHVLTWSTDFSDNGDRVINAADLSVLRRED